MKDKIRYIVAIISSLTLLISFVGVDVYRHFCNQTGNEFISIYVERGCQSDDENLSCCIEENISSESNDNNCCNETREQTAKIIRDVSCCSGSSEFISLNENFVISKVTIPYFYSTISVVIKINPASLPELDCYKEYINNIWHNINQPIKFIIRFIQALSQAGNPVSHKA